jgi:hypothetical protein
MYILYGILVYGKLKISFNAFFFYANNFCWWLQFCFILLLDMKTELYSINCQLFYALGYMCKIGLKDNFNPYKAVS